MAPPVPSQIDRIAKMLVADYCKHLCRVWLGNSVINTDWLQTRVAKLMRDTIMHEGC